MSGEFSRAKGKLAEELVKRKLWSYGLSVKDFSNYAPFDLIVNDKWKIEVKSAEEKNGKFSFVGIKWSYFDILALVFFQPIGYKIYFIRNTDKFAIKESLFLNEQSIKDLKLTTNPLKVLVGEPSKLGMLPNKPILKTGNWYSLSETSIILKTSEYNTKMLIDNKVLKASKSGFADGTRYRIKGEWIVICLSKLDTLGKN